MQKEQGKAHVDLLETTVSIAKEPINFQITPYPATYPFGLPPSYETYPF